MSRVVWALFSCSTLPRPSLLSLLSLLSSCGGGGGGGAVVAVFVVVVVVVVEVRTECLVDVCTHINKVT